MGCQPSLSGVTLGVTAAFKAGRRLLGEPPDRADDWQLEQLIWHGRGTYWKFLLLLWLRDGGLPKEIKAWSQDEFVGPAITAEPRAGFPAALCFLSLETGLPPSPTLSSVEVSGSDSVGFCNFDKAASVDLCGPQMPSHWLSGPVDSRLVPLTSSG